MQRTLVYSLGVAAVSGLLLAVLVLAAAVIGTGVPAAEGDHGMFGMVTALVVQER